MSHTLEAIQGSIWKKVLVGMMLEDGEKAFRYLWEITHHQKIENIPLKASTVKSLLEWSVMGMNKRLLKKLGITDIDDLTDAALVERVGEDQRRRTVVRKQKQIARGTKGRKKKDEVTA